MTTRTLDFQQWYDDHGAAVASTVWHLLLIVVLALIARALLHRLINRLINTAITGGPLQPLKDKAKGTRFDATPLLSERRRQRTETLGSVLRSIASFTVAAVAITMMLAELGFDLTPIIASAGVIGLAIGFGAQSFVRDFLNGMSMLMEDQYGVGDVIDLGPAVGTVEAVSLRTTRLRDSEGTVWHVRNGEIVRVGNKGQGWSKAVLDLPVAPGTDLATFRGVVMEVARGLAADPAYADRVLEAPEISGLESIGRQGHVLRLTVKTAPLEQWAVERELRERLIRAFAERGTPLDQGA